MWPEYNQNTNIAFYQTLNALKLIVLDSDLRIPIQVVRSPQHPDFLKHVGIITKNLPDC